MVDAAAGAGGQTVANAHLAHKPGPTTDPRSQKVDVPEAGVPAVHRYLDEGRALLWEEANGDVGYFIANIKTTADIKIGDTITDQRRPARDPLPGFQEIHPMVFSGIYPINTGDFEHLKVAIGKLRLNDAAFIYTPESSVALGFGFRCGFLGLLHMEIIQERLRREYDMDIIATSPSVVYEVLTTRGEKLLNGHPV